ncbi:MAG: T9SS type A sorting domain-containing protein [bacterium]
MKNLLKLLLIAIVSVAGLNISFAGSDSVFIKPTYIMTATNPSWTANTFEFDVYMKHTNHDVTIFLYGANQYFMNFNGAAINNGGTLTMSIVESELAPALRPVNPTVFQNTQLRLAANLPGGPSTTDTVKWTGLGTKVLRLRLTNTQPFIQDIQAMNLRWRNAVNPFTKITCYTGLNGTVLTEIQDTTLAPPVTGHFIDFPTGISPDPISSIIPTEFSLSQNFPNPFNPTTKIEYGLPVEGAVSMKIFDVTGREVMTLVNEIQTAGIHAVNFNGVNLASGMYFYRIEVQSVNDKKYEFTRRMVLIK